MDVEMKKKITKGFWVAVGTVTKTGGSTRISASSVLVWCALSAIWRWWQLLELLGSALVSYCWWLFPLVSFLRVVYLNYRRSNLFTWRLAVTTFGQVAIAYTICTLLILAVGSYMDFLCWSESRMEEVIPRLSRSWNLLTLMFAYALVGEIWDFKDLLSTTQSCLCEAISTMWVVIKIIPVPALYGYFGAILEFNLEVLVTLLVSFILGAGAILLCLLCLNLALKAIWCLDIYAKAALVSVCRVAVSCVRRGKGTGNADHSSNNPGIVTEPKALNVHPTEDFNTEFLNAEFIAKDFDKNDGKGVIEEFMKSLPVENPVSVVASMDFLHNQNNKEIKIHNTGSLPEGMFFHDGKSDLDAFVLWFHDFAFTEAQQRVSFLYSEKKVYLKLKMGSTEKLRNTHLLNLIFLEKSFDFPLVFYGLAVMEGKDAFLSARHCRDLVRRFFGGEKYENSERSHVATQLERGVDAGSHLDHMTSYQWDALCRGSDDPALKAMVSIARTEKGKQWIGKLFRYASNLSCDRVFAVACEGWPQPARGWPARKRRWPDTEVVDNIIQSGFHIVPKSSPGGDIEREWRLSFSDAEMLLVQQYNVTQRCCFLAVKAMLNAEIKSKFDHGYCTYYAKTAMLWACEKAPPEMWRDDNLSNCISSLITSLAIFYWDGHKSHLPHFFVPCFDLIAHLEQSLKRAISEELLRVRNNLEDIAQVHLSERRGLWTCTLASLAHDIPQEIADMVSD